jgi:hypothetical protein
MFGSITIAFRVGGKVSIFGCNWDVFPLFLSFVSRDNTAFIVPEYRWTNSNIIFILVHILLVCKFAIARYMCPVHPIAIYACTCLFDSCIQEPISAYLMSIPIITLHAFVSTNNMMDASVQ